MEMMLFKGVLLLIAITGVEGLQKIWQFNYFSQTERTVKTILESCYPNDSLSESIVIFGDFNELIDGSSIVRLDSYVFFSPTGRDIARAGDMTSKDNKILLIPESPETLKRDLLLLWRTRWWDHMARFFIIAKTQKGCEDFRTILEITWMMDILNSIYICVKSKDVTALYTLNPMANYAPHPWKKVEKQDDMSVFHQVFDANVSCANLNYDKTKILSAHEIKAVMMAYPENVDRTEENDIVVIGDYENLNYRIFQLIIKALNVNYTLFAARDWESWELLNAQQVDIMVDSSTLTSYLGLPFLLPHKWTQMIAVVKLSPELSTLQKILHLWSGPVLIVAGVAILVLYLILAIKNRNLSLALLDLVRLLTDTSIQTNVRSHWFRIYFTTMLIFMIISNGVFQGQIAAFLTKEERAGAIETIDELVKLQYHMYTSGTASYAMERCPKCTFKRVDLDSCINHVLNSTRHVCGIDRHEYEANYILLPLEEVKQLLNEEFENLKCRPDWPLQERVNEAIMSIVESGIIDFWKMQESHELKGKRKAMEAEWSSAQYKPVRLYKLEFAFQGLACGLGLAIIVFCLEIWWENYGSKMVLKWYLKIHPR